MGVGVPEWGAVVFVDDEFAVGTVGIAKAAESELTGGVIAGSAGEFAGGVLFAGAPGATIDVEPDDGATGVDEFLREVEGVERVSADGVAKLPDDGGDLVVVASGVVTRVRVLSVWWKSLMGGGGVVGRVG